MTHETMGMSIGVAVSDSPTGPFKDALGKPLIHSGYGDIDPSVFIDDDGQAYLYWGSGFHWVNGHCMAVKLGKDMVSFMSKPIEITPPHYFEGPHMIKRNGKYYLMYSNGKAIDATYNIRYSVSNTPLGPWQEGPYSPILSTTDDSTTYGPGHHTVFREGGQDYILYHRIHPQKEQYVLRQLCIDSLNYDSEGNILKIHPKGVADFTKNDKR